MSLRHRILTLAAAGALVFGALGDAMAKPGGGGSFGSRGSRTHSAPPATSTAPSTAAPMQRTQTPQAAPSPGLNRPQAAQPAGGMFGKGMLGGFAAGLLGAGLIGMLMGNGFAGGLGSIMSFLGLLLQVGLIFLIVKFAIGFFRNRSNPAPAGAAAYRAPAPGPTPPSGGPLGGLGGSVGGLAGGLGGMMGGMTGGGAAAPAQRKLALTPDDFNAFEKRLQEVQNAFGREDRATLMTLMTPEMTGYLVEELDNNARDGVVNRISEPKLLQGDLSEAWAEPDAEYATVAMRFSLIDAMVERASGRTVAGSLTDAVETVELWTFRRRPGGAPGDWMLSAIQQVS
jgi:predicted lipid-binding transport protein (Tim44 family)